MQHSCAVVVVLGGVTGVNVAGLGDCQVWAKYPENEALISLNTPNNMNSEEVFQNLRSRKCE